MFSWRKPVADCGEPRPHTNGSELQAVRQPSWPRVQGRTEAHRSPLLRQLRLSGLYAGAGGSCNHRRRRPTDRAAFSSRHAGRLRRRGRRVPKETEGDGGGDRLYGGETGFSRRYVGWLRRCGGVGVSVDSRP